MGKLINRPLLLLMLVLGMDHLIAQDVPVLFPQVGQEFDFSEELQADEEKEDVWDIVGIGCSWYCGGGPDNVSASSSLNGQEPGAYAAGNAHDLSYQTAWAEGAAGQGIGEYLEYNFSGESPRITKIIVVNGYVKNPSVWQANSRVKKLKVYYKDKPVAILMLEDVRAEQSFEVTPLGTSDRKDFTKMTLLPHWQLKFEILEVYPGDKYQDTVISEIYFDGLDVH